MSTFPGHTAIVNPPMALPRAGRSQSLPMPGPCGHWLSFCPTVWSLLPGGDLEPHVVGCWGALDSESKACLWGADGSLRKLRNQGKRGQRISKQKTSPLLPSGLVLQTPGDCIMSSWHRPHRSKPPTDRGKECALPALGRWPWLSLSGRGKPDGLGALALLDGEVRADSKTRMKTNSCSKGSNQRDPGRRWERP